MSSEYDRYTLFFLRTDLSSLTDSGFLPAMLIVVGWLLSNPEANPGPDKEK